VIFGFHHPRKKERRGERRKEMREWEHEKARRASLFLKKRDAR